MLYHDILEFEAGLLIPGGGMTAELEAALFRQAIMKAAPKVVTKVITSTAPVFVKTSSRVIILTSITRSVTNGARIMTQFSKSTIDDAVKYAMKNKATHIFNKVAHKLEPLVTKLGGQENTVRAVLEAANGKLPSSGVFKDVVVNVEGYNIYIRGMVQDGVPKLGTMFIK